jgi:hypothetical protein
VFTSYTRFVVSARCSAALPFVALGAVCVVAGGLVSAASAFAPSEHAAWAAAYLVLLAGALALVAWEVRGHAGRARWPLRAFRGLVALLVVSIPVGLVLAQLRPA